MTHFEEERPQGMPVDLTKEEYIAYHLATSKAFGSLKRQGMLIVLFAIYMIVTVVGGVQQYLETGEISLVMLLMTGVTLAATVLSVTMVPAQVRRKAARSYDMGNINGYYGEWSITATAVTKVIGEDCVEMPLDDNTMYIEDTAFMAFISSGSQRIIILPARCMTEEAAKAVREQVFRGECRIHRRVIARMTPLAKEPIARRAPAAPPQTLLHMDVTYEPQELIQLHGDIAWRHYVHNLPGLVTVALLFAALFALLEESVLLFAVIFLGILLAFLVFSTLAGRRAVKRQTAEQPTRLRLDVTDHGLKAAFQPSGQNVTIHWGSVSRAVERPTCVEFIYGDNHLLRIPKRCIDDMNELRRIVDRFHAPKK